MGALLGFSAVGVLLLYALLRVQDHLQGLGTQAFLSAAVGLATGIALIRGLTRRDTDQIGNLWVDTVCGTLAGTAAAVGALRTAALRTGPISNLVQIILMLLIPQRSAARLRPYGR